MKQITVRGIPNKIESIIKKEAKIKGLSLNRAIISLLEKAAGKKGKEKKNRILYHDLDNLSGLWTKEEAETFEINLNLQRKIDENLWKNKEL